MDDIEILYRFHFAGGELVRYSIKLDAETLELIPQAEQTPAAWMALDFNQCSNCTLDSESHSLCPVACNLGMLIHDCDQFPSYEDVHLEVITAERTISADTTIQRGLSSLLGLILATSNCPHTQFFRPMARFHLPLATEEETIYRAASMYLLAQYFRAKANESVDIEMQGLSDIYQNLQEVNQAIAKRLKSASHGDSAVNAIILLDLFAKALPFSIVDSLQEIQHLFTPYFESPSDMENGF